MDFLLLVKKFARGIDFFNNLSPESNADRATTTDYFSTSMLLSHERPYG